MCACVSIALRSIVREVGYSQRHASKEKPDGGKSVTILENIYQGDKAPSTTNSVLAL
jgi:hypothetical protein